MERENAWKKYTAADLEELESLAADYIAFISENKTERECTAAAIAAAEAAGYLPLDMAIEKGIEANIAYASTREIGSKVFGSMLLGIPGGEENVREAVAYMQRSEGVLAEEVEVNAG